VLANFNEYFLLRKSGKLIGLIRTICIKAK